MPVSLPASNSGHHRLLPCAHRLEIGLQWYLAPASRLLPTYVPSAESKDADMADEEQVVEQEPEGEDVLHLTARIVSAHVSNNSVSPDDLPTLIRTVYEALKRSTEGKAPPFEPAVPIKKSVTPNYIVCLEDGTKHKMLKRHLRTAHEITPDEYREKWGFPPDYPLVAPAYAKQRRELAKKIGLGRKARRSRPKGKGKGAGKK